MILRVAAMNPLRGNMKAIVKDAYGSAEALRVEEIEKPEISDNDVLVRVHAAGLAVTV